MKKILLAGLVLIFASSLFLPSISAAPRSPRNQGKPPALGPYVPDEVLVEFKPGIRTETAAAAVGARVSSRIPGLDIYVLKVPQGTVEATVLALSHNPLVEFAEPNGYVHTFAQDPNDPLDNNPSCLYPSGDPNYSCQWFWARVQAYDAWDAATGTTGSNSVIVAVVDTGIDAGDPYGLPPDAMHPDFASCGRTIMLKSYVSGETGDDDNGHGTHVAGVIGACTNNNYLVAGANWNVTLVGVKVLSWYGGGTWSAVASGIRYAADNKAKVINLSLGGSSGSRTLRKAVDYAWNSGVVLVCAAGNSGNSAPSYPAYYSNCLAVAATDKNDVKTSWSTYGNWVDVSAPGLNILSLIQDQWEWCYLCWGEGYQEGYDYLSGTSMATSVVSGLAALVWAKYPAATNSWVRSRIEQKADWNSGAGSVWGRVNYYRAVSEP